MGENIILFVLKTFQKKKQKKLILVFLSRFNINVLALLTIHSVVDNEEPSNVWVDSKIAGASLGFRSVCKEDFDKVLSDL